MRRCAQQCRAQGVLARRRQHRCQSTSPAVSVAPEQHAGTETTSKPRHDAFQVDLTTKTIRTPAGDLPISPLMDQDFLDAREKWKQPKPAKSPFKKTKFQNALERNPFAQALATPPRKCQMTEARLPSYFLQGFNIIQHPETADPWWVPHDLLASQQASSSTPTSRDPDNAADTPDMPSSPSSDLISDEATESASGPVAPRPENIDPTVPDLDSPSTPTPSRNATQKPGLGTGWILAWQPLLTGFASKKAFSGKYFRAFQRMIRSANTSGNLNPILNRAAWRPDMDAVALELMRKRLVDGLIELAELTERDGRGYIARCEGYGDVGKVLHPGCVLVFGGVPGSGEPVAVAPDAEDEDFERYDENDTKDESVEESTIVADTGNNEISPLGRVGGFVTVDVDGNKFCHKMPVYDLDRLLGKEHVRSLRTRTSIMRSGDVFVLARARSTELQSWLWKLQGFMANAPEFQVMKGWRPQREKWIPPAELLQEIFDDDAWGELEETPGERPLYFLDDNPDMGPEEELAKLLEEFAREPPKPYSDEQLDDD